MLGDKIREEFLEDMTSELSHEDLLKLARRSGGAGGGKGIHECKTYPILSL